MPSQCIITTNLIYPWCTTIVLNSHELPQFLVKPREDVSLSFTSAKIFVPSKHHQTFYPALSTIFYTIWTVQCRSNPSNSGDHLSLRTIGQYHSDPQGYWQRCPPSCISIQVLLRATHGVVLLIELAEVESADTDTLAVKSSSWGTWL